MVRVDKGKFLQANTISPQVFAYLKRLTDGLAPHERMVILTFNEFKFDLFANVDSEGFSCGEKIPTHMIVPTIRFVYDRTFHTLGTLFYYNEYRRKNSFKFSNDISECMKLYILALQNIRLTVIATVAPYSETFCTSVKELCNIPYFNEHVGPLSYKVGGSEIIHIHDPAFVENCYARFFLENDLAFEVQGEKYTASILDVRECLQIEKKPLFQKKSSVLDAFVPVEAIGRYYLSSTVSDSLQRLFKRKLLPESSFGTALFIKLFKELFEEFYANTTDAKYLIFHEPSLQNLRNFVVSLTTRTNPDQSPEISPVKTEDVPKKSKLVRNLKDIDSYVKKENSQLSDETAVFKENAKKLEYSIYSEMCNTPDFLDDENTVITTASGKTLTAQSPRLAKKSKKKGKAPIPPDVRKELIKARLAAAVANQPSASPGKKGATNQTITPITPSPKKKLPDSSMKKDSPSKAEKIITADTSTKKKYAKNIEGIDYSNSQPSTSKTETNNLSHRREKEKNEKNKESTDTTKKTNASPTEKKLGTVEKHNSKSKDPGIEKSEESSKQKGTGFGQKNSKFINTNSGEFEVSNLLDYELQFELTNLEPIPITVKDLEEALSKTQTSTDAPKPVDTDKVDQSASEYECKSLVKEIFNINNMETIDITDFVDFEHISPSLLTSLISKVKDVVEDTFVEIDNKVSDFDKQLKTDIEEEINESLNIEGNSDTFPEGEIKESGKKEDEKLIFQENEFVKKNEDQPEFHIRIKRQVSKQSENRESPDQIVMKYVDQKAESPKTYKDPSKNKILKEIQISESKYSENREFLDQVVTQSTVLETTSPEKPGDQPTTHILTEKQDSEGEYSENRESPSKEVIKTVVPNSGSPKKTGNQPKTYILKERSVGEDIENKELCGEDTDKSLVSAVKEKYREDIVQDQTKTSKKALELEDSGNRESAHQKVEKYVAEEAETQKKSALDFHFIQTKDLFPTLKTKDSEDAEEESKRKVELIEKGEKDIQLKEGKTYPALKKSVSEVDETDNKIEESSVIKQTRTEDGTDKSHILKKKSVEQEVENPVILEDKTAKQKEEIYENKKATDAIKETITSSDQQVWKSVVPESATIQKGDEDTDKNKSPPEDKEDGKTGVTKAAYIEDTERINILSRKSTSNLPLGTNEIEICYIDGENSVKNSVVSKENTKQEKSISENNQKDEIPESVEPVLHIVEKTTEDYVPENQNSHYNEKYGESSETDSNTEGIPELIIEPAPIFALVSKPKNVISIPKSNDDYEMDEVPDLVEDIEPVTSQTEIANQRVESIENNKEDTPSNITVKNEERADNKSTVPNSEYNKTGRQHLSSKKIADNPICPTNPELDAITTVFEDSSDTKNSDKEKADSSAIKKVRTNKFDAVIECVKETFGIQRSPDDTRIEKNQEPANSSESCLKISWKNKNTVSIETVEADKVTAPSQDPFKITDLREIESKSMDDKSKKKICASNLSTVASRLDPGRGPIKPTMNEQIQAFLESFSMNYQLVTRKPETSSEASNTGVEGKKDCTLSDQDVEDITNWRNYHRFANCLNSIIRSLALHFNLPLSAEEVFRRVHDDSLKLIIARRTSPTEDENEIMDLYYAVYQDYLGEEIIAIPEVNETLDKITRYLDTMALQKVEVSGYKTRSFYLMRNLWLNNSYGIQAVFQKLRTHDSYDELAPDLFKTDHVFQLMEHIHLYGNNFQSYNIVFDCCPLDIEECFDTLTPKGSVLLVE